MNVHRSIHVGKLDYLLEHLKAHFELWATSFPTYHSRFPGDPLEGKRVEWNGMSGPVQYFLQQYTKREGIDLLREEEFKDCFSESKADISVSYVWSSTKLENIAGILPPMLIFG